MGRLFPPRLVGRAGFPQAGHHAGVFRLETTWKQRALVIERAGELCTAEPGIGQIGALEARRAVRQSADSPGAGEVRANENSFGAVGAAEIGMAKVGAREAGFDDITRRAQIVDPAIATEMLDVAQLGFRK